jgi:hypothetical protein
MNHRDYNPNQSCLPPQAYTALWAAACQPPKPPSKLRRLCAALRRILPLAFLVAALPVETPRDMAERTESLVWVQPKAKEPKAQPLPKWTL